MMPFAAMRLRGTSAPVGPLLDTYGSAVAAYSVRKLRTAYAGACLRVVTSAAGNAETDIGFDGSGNLDETALIAAIGSNTGTVKTWYDQSGNGLDITNATLAQQPVIVSAGVLQKKNSRMSMVFDGSNDVLTSGFSATISTNRQLTSAIVHQSGSVVPASARIFVFQRTGGYDFQSGYLYERRTTALAVNPGTGTTGAFATTNYQEWGVSNSNISALMIAQTHVNGTGGTQSLYLDGTLQTITSIGGTMALSSYMNTGSGNHRLILGAGSQNQTNTISDWWLGNVSEMVAWITDRTTDQAGIRSNQKSYFGTP